ncbi:hypothetical protein [Aestuariivirga sp.]|uniref:hypothetical protein n=1 Tax=Aestuariivirga sp. TaxID=2650926 RepID=UPI00391D590A
MLRSLAAAVLLLLTATAAPAQQPVPQQMGDRLRAGELRLLEGELAARLAESPGDDQARFALGATQFIRAVEGLAQDMYRHGLQPPRDAAMLLPFFRFPLPPNPRAEPLDYEKMRAVFKRALEGLGKADATLAGLGNAEVKLPVAVGLARLDLDGNGKADEQESLFAVFNATLGGGNLPPEAAERFIISFDRGDAAWLRGYANLLSALIEFMLAHDGKLSFEASAHMLFPDAGLPNAVLDRQPGAPADQYGMAAAADLLAAVHLMHWPVTEPKRMASALAHLEQTASLSRESWRFILAETDDEAEWIPSPRQTKGVTGVPVTEETLDGWMVFLSEFEALLKGEKLVPHWRLAKGINLRRVFLEPRPFDPILWAQGSAALPYLEDGPMTDAQTWNRIMEMFSGNFLNYALWFN